MAGANAAKWLWVWYFNLTATNPRLDITVHLSHVQYRNENFFFVFYCEHFYINVLHYTYLIAFIIFEIIWYIFEIIQCLSWQSMISFNQIIEPIIKLFYRKRRCRSPPLAPPALLSRYFCYLTVRFSCGILCSEIFILTNTVIREMVYGKFTG